MKELEFYDESDAPVDGKKIGADLWEVVCDDCGGSTEAMMPATSSRQIEPVYALGACSGCDGYGMVRWRLVRPTLRVVTVPRGSLSGRPYFALEAEDADGLAVCFTMPDGVYAGLVHQLCVPESDDNDFDYSDFQTDPRVREWFDALVPDDD